ncbi:MAG: P-loop NTPase fold protein, partial [Oceanobacter sp.]
IFLLLVIGLVLIPVAVSWAFQIFSIQKFLKFFCGSEDPGKKQEKGFKSVSLKELGEMPRKERNGIIKNWLENESPAQTIDFYNREKLVERMSKRLLDNNIKRGQVLFGDYGTGKTTALREVGEKLRESGEKWIISSVNTWGKTEEPEQLIEIVLESIISDISDAGIETTSLLSLPESYVRAAYTGYNYLSWLFLLDGAKSVRKVIAKINDALVLHDKKLLICIEDLDRVYDVRKAAPAIMGFLDEIGRGDLTNNGYDISSNIHFVFSLRRDEVTIEFANKTAEYIEDTSMSSSYSMLKFFFELCNNDPENPLPEGVIHLDRLYGKDDELPLIDDPSQKDANLIYLFRYLESARSTKRVLRSTREIFLALKGNATLTDIFKIQIMREHGDLYEMFKSLQPSDKSFAEMVTDASKASGKNKADTPISIGVDVTVGNLSSDGSPAQIYQLQGHSRDKTKTHATDHDAAINFLKKLDFVTSGGKGYGLAFAAPDNRTEILNVAPSNDNF